MDRVKELWVPAGVGLGVWLLIGLTSRHQVPWNDPRFWPLMIVAGFVLGMRSKEHPRRTGILLGASGLPAGMAESMVHLRVLAILPAAPMVFLLFGAVCIFPVRAGALAKEGLDRLAARVRRPIP
jgi:hypothetical protein